MVSTSKALKARISGVKHCSQYFVSSAITIFFKEGGFKSSLIDFSHKQL